MADLIPGAKNIGIDRNQRTAMIAVGLAAFVLVFSIFFGLRLYNKQAYQNHVISNLECANKNIRQSRDSLHSLEKAFEDFNAADPILGEKKQGDIQNSVVVLRALPAEYTRSQIQLFWNNFLLEDHGTGLGGEGLRGDGDGYKGVVNFPSTPEVEGSEGGGSGGLKEILFTLQVDVESQEEMDKLFEDLNNFIMPVKILSLDLNFVDPDSGSDGYASLNMRLKTYVQGESNISVSTETLQEGSTQPGSCS